MDRAKIGRAIRSGFVATLAMSVILYISPSMVPPRMDIAAMFGSVLGGSWWLGLAIHFAIGSLLFSFLYAYLFYSLLPGRPWMKGTLWGVTLWLLAQTTIIPMLGMGVFSANIPGRGTAILGSLLAHLVYGTMLGAMLGAIASGETHGATSRAQKAPTLGLTIPTSPNGQAAMRIADAPRPNPILLYSERGR